MKLLRTFTDQLHANLSKSLLESQGIKTKMDGSKEYVGHLTGSGAGVFRLYVEDWQDFEDADRILKDVEAEMPAASRDDLTPNYFRKSLFAAIGAMILLPIVFNVASLINAKKFWEHSEKDTTATIKFAFLIAMQLPSIYFIYFGYQMLTGMLDTMSGIGTGVEDF